ncbi:MAG: chromosome partitioning protein ParB, partial [Thermoprotei archaeon]
MSSREKVRIKIPKYDIPAVKLEYVLLDAEALLPHEEIVTERLSDVIRSIEDQGALDMPIIVAPIPGSSKYLI